MQALAQPLRVRRICLYLGVALFLVLALFPFYWMLATSLKTPREIMSVPPTYIPTMPSLEPYERLFAEKHFGDYTFNSFFVAVFSTVIGATLSAIAAYSFARFRFPGKGALIAAVLVTSMLPIISMLGPLYIMIRNAGLQNTRWGLIAVYASGQIPFAIWFLFVFFQSIPSELEESARVDGCTHLGAFFRIVLPLSLPGLITVVIFYFLGCWNEFIFALVLTLSPAAKTLTVGITEIPGIWEIPYDYMSAAGTIAALPAIVVVLFFQRYIIEGMTAGAIKG